MCQNCKPQIDSAPVTDASPVTPRIVPGNYHRDRVEYTSGVGEISQDTLTSISGFVAACRWFSDCTREELPNVDTLAMLFLTAYRNGTTLERTEIVAMLDDNLSRYTDNFRLILPNAYPQYGDTPDKQEANCLKLAKQWVRFISDLYGAKLLKGESVYTRPIVDSLEPYAKDFAGVTFGKRLAKACFDTGLKLTKQQIETIGNMIAERESKPLTAMLSFDDDYLTGTAREYGNYKSCWWGSSNYGNSRASFHEIGGHACRSWSSDGNVNGRCWITKIENGQHLVFNAYGYDLIQFVKMITHEWRMSYVKVDIDAPDFFFINGGTGYIIGDKAKLPASDSVYELDIEEIEDERETCCHCGDRIDDGEAYPTPGGYSLCCESCYCDRYTSCDRCGETYDMDDVRRCGDDYYCESCAERRGYRECDDCHEWHNDTTEVSTGDCVCGDCLDSYYCCEGCEEYFTDDAIAVCDQDNCQYCCDCMPEPEGEQYCQATGEVIDADDIDSGHWMTSAVSSRSHCPGLIGFENGDPIQSYPIQHMLDTVNRDGIDCMLRPSRELACTVLMLCLAGF